MELKIATWNVNSVRAREEVIARWLDEESPDILCMQEIKVENDLFPRESFTDRGYSLYTNGQKTWNGVAVASRIKSETVSRDLPSGFLNDQKRLITVDFSQFTVVNVYVPNGGDVTLDRFRDKLRFLEELKEYLRELPRKKPLVLMGDFNVAPGDDDVYDAGALAGKVCFHPEERSRLKQIEEMGLSDVYRRFNPHGKAFSWWDYRGGSFRQNLGMRLDLILLNHAASELAVACDIRIEPRKWQKPSDHTPVVLTMRM